MLFNWAGLLTVLPPWVSCGLCSAIRQGDMLGSAANELLRWTLQLGDTLGWALRLLRVNVQASWFSRARVNAQIWAGLLAWFPAFMVHRTCFTTARHLCPHFPGDGSKNKKLCSAVEWENKSYFKAIIIKKKYELKKNIQWDLRNKIYSLEPHLFWVSNMNGIKFWIIFVTYDKYYPITIICK